MIGKPTYSVFICKRIITTMDIVASYTLLLVSLTTAHPVMKNLFGVFAQECLVHEVIILLFPPAPLGVSESQVVEEGVQSLRTESVGSGMFICVDLNE